MPSGAYQEIIHRIPLLTPEEKKQVIGFLHINSGRADESSDHGVAAVGQNGTETSPARLVPLKSFEEEKTWISQHQDQYRGQFVALAGTQLLAHGIDEGEVIDRARLAGFPSPFVTYIETEAEKHSLGGWLTPIE